VTGYRGKGIRPDQTVDIDLGHVELVVPEDRRPTPATTLGTALHTLDELDIDEDLDRLGFRQVKRFQDAFDRQYRDQAIATASGRWTDDFEPRRRDYVPGDVCGLRAGAMHGTLVQTREIADRDEAALQPGERERTEHELAICAWLYSAVPHFLGVSSAIGITGSYPPEADLLDALVLPYPAVAVYFGADLTLPGSLIGADRELHALAGRTDNARGEGQRRFRADEFPPFTMTGAHLALSRRQEIALAGVVFHAEPDGRLADLVLWLTVVPDLPAGHRRRVTPGFLSRATARPLALNLAAVAAWGAWTPPPVGLHLPDDIESPAWRKHVRRGQFRRHEPTGAALGVRVLDVSRGTDAASPGDDSHGSPATHMRRGHWRRQRVGPREDWRYEQRWIAPVLVNPGNDRGTVTVYRLPEPPDPG
jgi:hypothetical protein